MILNRVPNAQELRKKISLDSRLVFLIFFVNDPDCGPKFCCDGFDTNNELRELLQARVWEYFFKYSTSTMGEVNRLHY